MKNVKTKFSVAIFAILVLSMLHLIPYRTTEKNITVGNATRSYLLHLPSGYDSSQKYPLVIMIHGYSDHPRLMELYSGMSKKADKEKFIVVYPKGSNDAQDRRLSWNAGFCCGGARRQNSDDVGFINTLLDEVTTTYSVNTKKVYVAGFSNGAMMAHALGTQLPTRITAIAAISGTIGSYIINAKRPPTPLPVLIINGTADRTIPFNGGGTYTSVKDTLAFWKSVNKTSHEIVSKDKSYNKTIYSNSDNKNEVVFYEINNGTHIWFGTKKEVFTVLFNQPIFTTDEVWNFFKNY